MGRPFLKIALFVEDVDPWFPGPTRVRNPKGISIGSAIFAGLTIVIDRQTDRQITLLGR